MAEESKNHWRRNLSSVSRRQMLAATAGGTIAGLAGCSGSDDVGEEGEGEGEGRTFRTRITTVPTDITFNPYQTNTDWYLDSLIHGFPAALSRRAPLQWVPILAKNWELDGETFTIELNENFTWHNGNDVTAEDLALQYEISHHMSAGKFHSPLENLEDLPQATDEYTVEMNLTQDISEEVFVPQHFGEPAWYEPEFFEPYVEKFRDASSDDEKEEIRAEVGDAEWEKPIGFGPLKYVERDNQKVVLEYFEDYPFEEVQEQFTDVIGQDITGFGRPNFDTVHAKYVSSHNNMTQEVMSNSIEGGTTSGITTEDLPDGIGINAQPVLHGSGLMFNFWDWGEAPGLDIWKDVNVRKALAHAIDRDATGIQLGGDDAVTDSLMTGLLEDQEQEWLDGSFEDQLDSYEHDYDKAEEYLREAGCTKEDGTWHKPDGDVFEVRMKTGACVTHYVNAFEVVKSNLQELGLEPVVETEDCSSFFSKDDNDSGMQMTTAYWGGGQAHPYFAFDWMYKRNWVKSENDDERDYYLPGDPRNGEEETLEVPPVGQPDSDERNTVDPKALVEELGAVQDEAEQEELVKELVWATNWSVPKITCNENDIVGVVNRTNFEYPEEESPALSVHPFFSMIHHLGVVDEKN